MKAVKTKVQDDMPTPVREVAGGCAVPFRRVRPSVCTGCLLDAIPVSACVHGGGCWTAAASCATHPRLAAASLVCTLTLQVYGAADETGDYLADVQRKMKLNIIRNTPEELVFDMIGVDAPLANALRRILIAEVCVCVLGATTARNVSHAAPPTMLRVGPHHGDRACVRVGEHVRHSGRGALTSAGSHPTEGRPPRV